MTQQDPKIEQLEWNIHEIVPTVDPDVMVEVQCYSTNDGHQYIPIRFYGYEYWINPKLWWGTDISTNDIIRICFTFPNERISRNLVLPTLRVGDLFVDVGAMYGSWTLPAAAMHANVMAFEPDSYSASVLEEHIKLNKCEKRVQVVQDFVGKKRTNSIDRWKLDKVKLIKIDVEGSEFDVLEGAVKTINRCKCNLLVELHTMMHGKKLDEYMTFLTNLCPKVPYRHYILPQKTAEKDDEYYHIYSFL